MNTVDEILDFAIKRETEAAAFYLNLAGRTESANMKKVFLEFSEEEQLHKARLESVKQGEHALSAQQEVVDLKMSDYLVAVEINEDLDYQDALIVGMKREQAAFQLYTDMAANVSDEAIRELFQALAKEEAKHKLYFESEYDERVLTDN
jgi:rubrerythrin